MGEKYTIDRFEGEFAICENRNSGKIVKIEKIKLPLDIKEGTIIKKINNKYIEDIEETKEVSKKIKEKMDNLWN